MRLAKSVNGIVGVCGDVVVVAAVVVVLWLLLLL